MSSAQRETIPRLIHFVWLGSEPGPDLLETIERVRCLNPLWEIRLWRDEDLDWLENRTWFDSSPTYAGRANIARYEILLRHGGLYVDADFDFLKPFEELGIEFNGLVVAPEFPGCYCNAIFGSPPGHPFLARLVERVGPSIANDPTAMTQRTSGPTFFTNELARWAEDTGGKWTEIDRDLVFPYSYDTAEAGADMLPLSPHVVAIHRWSQAANGRVWVNGAPPSRPHQRSTLDRLAEWARPRSRFRSVRGSIDQLIWRPNSLYLGDGRALTVSRAGRSVIFDTADANLLGNLVSKGEWDESFHRFLRKTLSGSDVYVDVGANIGQFVVTASMALSRYGRVFAFEPNPRVADTLSLNIAMAASAAAEAKVIIRRVAVSNTSGAATLYVPRAHAGHGSIIAEAVAEVDLKDLDRIEVPCVTLDDELDRLSRIRLLKVDVEGNEPAVLRGALGLIDSGRVDLIDIESIRAHLGGGLVTLGELLDRWQDRGATFASIDRKGELVRITGRASRIVASTDRSHLVIDMRPAHRSLTT